jgi:hypothetical protein
VTSVTVPDTRRGALGRAATRSSRARRLPDGAQPWARRDAFLPGLLTVLGVVGLLTAWLGISDTVSLPRQSRWLGLGIGSVVLAGLGVVLWLAAGLTNLGRLRREVFAELARRAVTQAQHEPDASIEHATEWGIANGMRHYHRADCELLDGKDVRWLDAAAVAASNTVPCGICRPQLVLG